MNKHIKELAEQAWDATAVSPEFGHPVSFAEKLAELLVRECANIVNNVQPGYGDYRDQIQEQIRERSSQAILDYFQVN